MSLATKKYNYCINFIKGIACIFVVLMHCEFPGTLGVFVQCISRFCVPFFFMVSGYFSFYKEKKCIAPKIKHIGKIILGVTLFYTCFALWKKESIEISTRLVLEFVLLNEPILIAGQMWFLFALLYVYIVYAFVERKNLQGIACYSIPILTILYICLAQGAHVAGIYVPNIIYRNFLIEGFPIFMLGYWIHKNEERINLPNKVLVNIIVVFTLLCPIERALLGRDFGINICTFPQVTAIFLYGVKNPDKFKNHIIQTLGERHSMMIYILHPAVWQIVEVIYEKLSISEITLALYLMPILVVDGTILLSMLYYELIKLCNK